MPTGVGFAHRRPGFARPDGPFVAATTAPYKGTGETSYTIAVSSAPHIGNLVILATKGANNGVISGVTDSAGNSWTIENAPTEGTTAGLAYAIISEPLSASLGTITVTMSDSGAFCAQAFEFTGISGTLDSIAYGGSSGSVTKLTVGPVTTTVAADLLLSISTSGGNQTYSVSSPYDILSQFTVVPVYTTGSIAIAYAVAGAAGDYSASWAQSSDSNAAAILAAFQP